MEMAARPLTITVVNQSGTTLQFGNVTTIHGETIQITSGPNPLPNEGQAVLYTENSGLIGPQGSFSYAFQDGSGRAFNFNYNHPYGTGTTYVNVISPTGYTSSMPINNLPHHDASCTIYLQQLA
jgi:hypothetical protein